MISKYKSCLTTTIQAPLPQTSISIEPPPSPPLPHKILQLHNISTLRPHRLSTSPKSSSNHAKIACQNAFSDLAVPVRYARRKDTSSRTARRSERLRSIRPALGNCCNVPFGGGIFKLPRKPLRSTTSGESYVAGATTSPDLSPSEQHVRRPRLGRSRTYSKGRTTRAKKPVITRKILQSNLPLGHLCASAIKTLTYHLYHSMVPSPTSTIYSTPATSRTSCAASTTPYVAGPSPVSPTPPSQPSPPSKAPDWSQAVR